jgi:uncharacterized protein (TIGR02444 family)
MTHPLWTFSLHCYAQPGVAEACLEAQDRGGADVNLLLYAAWLAHRGLQLPTAQWPELQAHVSAWRLRVVQPLRALRRDWRDLPEAAQLRQQVQALELLAERLQQGAIWAWHERSAACAPAPDPGVALVAALGCLLPCAAGAPGERDVLVQRLAGLLAGPGVA